MSITSQKTQNKSKTTRIQVKYTHDYIKRKGYEGLTLQEINKKEIERLNNRFSIKG